MNEKVSRWAKLTKTGFVRSVFLRVLAILVPVSIIIAAAAFFSFTADIRSAALQDHYRQLQTTQQLISSRMEEVNSICYNIGVDSVFYLEPLDDSPTASREITQTLRRYLVGNSFIEHLAFCRVAEPDKLYTAAGERSLSEFFCSGLGMDEATAAANIDNIRQLNRNSAHVFGHGEQAYFGYLYPLPQLAGTAQAHVLVLVPMQRVQPLLDQLLLGGNGMLAIYDADGSLLYSHGQLDEELELDYFMSGTATQQDHRSVTGQNYVLQKVVSTSNSWTYLSVMQQSDLPGLAGRQIAFIAFVLLLLALSITVLLSLIIAQYRPIDRLAAQVAANDPERGGDARRGQDERALLAAGLASLQDDSEQKQKYQNAYYAAEAASQAKSAFLSSMSHDIRTPMNAIIGMTALARQHSNDQAYVDDCLQKVERSADYLLDIINNVLDMSRIEAGRIPIVSEPVAIPALLDSVVSLMTGAVQAKSQTLEVDISELRQPLVLGDNIHIVQVFVNILSNAVKFTPAAGRISLRVQQLDDIDARTGCYRFSFSDTGVGMPPEFIDRVFDTFSRADASSVANTEGTGLGMAIAKKLVELMGGSISCQSELGRGTTFTVELSLPFADEQQARQLRAAAAGGEHGPQAQAKPQLSGRRILLVEDNSMNREIARRLLAETGAEIVEANNGREAVAAFAAAPPQHFDLILMDIQMPLMNGYQATAAIRALPRADATTVPIYALTANTFDEDVRRVHAAGMNGHIGKPYNPQTLYRTLAQVLG